MSKSIVLNTPTFFKKDLCFSDPTSWAILTEPILPDLIMICSAVKSEGILSSYSLILFLSQLIDFGKSIKQVSRS